MAKKKVIQISGTIEEITKLRHELDEIREKERFPTLASFLRKVLYDYIDDYNQKNGEN